MSESRPSKVFLFDNGDPEMQKAYQNARAAFRYFWREVAWERKRIVPALDLACIKAPFSDTERNGSTEPETEHMWVTNVDFDGQVISGTLLNSPNGLKSIKAGDAVRIGLGALTDWMYVIGGEVFGAYTVNLMRCRMGHKERKEHDDAWGLNFGDPHKIRVVPEPKKSRGFLKSWFAKQPSDQQEHPMSEAMARSLKDQLALDLSTVEATIEAKDERGWTLLHHQALAGSAATVKVLLENGANPNVLTNDGITPLQLARSLGWDNVVEILVGAGAK